MTDPVAARPPAWERLRAPADGRLAVADARRLAVDVLRIVDGDLPDVRDATVCWAERLAPGGFLVWAARIDGNVATPFVIEAGRLETDAADPALARLLGDELALEWPEPTAGCACKGTTAGEVEAAARWRSVDAVKRATKAAFGACQGRRCVGGIAGALGLASDDPRSQITPRPPLVPLPVALLAAFAAAGEPPRDDPQPSADSEGG